MPDTVELAETAATWRSAYVHVPFCRRRCPYCDFAVVTPDEGATPEMADTYVDALISEVELEDVGDFALDAVNFGGGTPSALDPKDLGRIVAALDRRFGITAGAEVSLEANPEDWSAATTGEAWRAVGFNRVTFGVQSFDDAVLRDLGRAHDAAMATRAVRDAVEAGFPSVGIDLIFGSPAEDPESWTHTLETAIALEPHHVSTYALTVERGTALSRAVAAGAPAPNPDVQADRYEEAMARLGAAGYRRYEVSNFALPGHACRYNLATWGQGEFVAFGLGAHDHIANTRHRNVRRLDVYLDEIAGGRRPRIGAERLDPWLREQERLMLGLRRAAGVVAGPGGAELLRAGEGRRLVAAGVIETVGDRLVVARPLLTDAVVRAVLDLPAPVAVEFPTATPSPDLGQDFAS